MNRPLVSVGMPVYNGERYLADAIDCILSQSVSDFELIISDNASNDATPRICASYARRDRRIRYIRQSKNVGPSRNFNFVFKEAMAPYFKWASANDLCAPTLLEDCIATIERERDIVLAYGRAAFIDEDGHSIDYDASDSAKTISCNEVEPHARFAHLVNKMRYNHFHAGVFCSKTLGASALERLYPGGDLVLIAELALHGKIVQLPQVLFYRRIAAGAATPCRTKEEIHQLFHPGKKVGRFSFPLWRRTFGYFGAMRRAPISIGQKSRAGLYLLKRIYWLRKWYALEIAKNLVGVFEPSSGSACKGERNGRRKDPQSARPAHRKTATRIALLGPYGAGNLGDVAIQDTVLYQIRHLAPDALLSCISLDPIDTTRRHGVPCFPINARAAGIRPSNGVERTLVWQHNRTFARLIKKASRVIVFAVCHMLYVIKACRIMRHIDVLVVSGGGQLEDHWGGPWGHPFNLLTWTFLAKCRRRRIVFLSVGGRVHSRLSRVFLRNALNSADYRSYRDTETYEFIGSLNVPGPHRVCPDLAFGYPACLQRRPSRQPSESLVIGISPISVRAWNHADVGKYDHYLDCLASFAWHLLDAGNDVRLFPSQVKMDEPVVQTLHDRLRKRGLRKSDGDLSTVPINTVEDYLDAVGGVDIVVASRLHGLLLSLVAGTPVVAISYHDKVRMLMDQMQLSAFTIQVNDVAQATLVAKFHDLTKRTSRVVREIRFMRSRFRQAVNSQFRDVFQNGRMDNNNEESSPYVHCLDVPAGGNLSVEQRACLEATVRRQ